MFKKRSPKTTARRQPITTPNSKVKTVFSYYSGGKRSAGTASNSNTPARGSRPTRSKLRRAFAMILIAFAATGVLYSLLVSDRPTVQIGQDKANQALLQNPEVYAQAAAKLIEASPFNRNKLTFDAAGVAGELESQFTEIANVTVVLPLVGHDPVLHIESFEPKLVLVADNNAFILDKQGRAQSDSTTIKGLNKLNLPVVKDESGLPLESGQLVLSQEQVGFISEVAYQLKAKDVDIANMTLPSGGSELTVQVRDTPYIIRFNLYGKAKEQAGQYLAARQYFESRAKPADYVDARVENRIYYR